MDGPYNLLNLHRNQRELEDVPHERREFGIHTRGKVLFSQVEPSPACYDIVPYCDTAVDRNRGKCPVRSGTGPSEQSLVCLGSPLPLYVVGVPIFLLILRTVPIHPQPRSKLPASRFLVLLLICFPVTYLGNVIGSLLSAALSGGTAQNGIETYLTDGGFLALFTTIIVAPVVEEFVFRKQLLDRCGRYGEKTAMVFSALAFGLFHMNFYQFFYAFGVGLILAYVYLRTHSLRYPVLIHMIINFLGSAVPLFMMSRWIEGYLLVDLGLAVAGLVAAIVYRKRFSLSPAPCELPREGRVKTVYGNVGFVLFALFCAVMFALAL